jgi:hypothetical protein
MPRMTREEVVKISPLGSKLILWDKATGKKYPGTWIVHEIYPDGEVSIKQTGARRSADLPSGDEIIFMPKPLRKRARKRD